MINIYRKNKSGTMLYGVLLAGLATLFCMTAKAQISLSATSGTTSANYTTFKAAIDSINSGFHQGAITIKVHASTSEGAAISLSASGTGAALYTSVLIAPADTATTVKSIAPSVTAINFITLDGADNVTIDGRPLGAGNLRLLEFNTNNSTTSITLRLINGATNNVVRNTRLVNGGATSTGNNVVLANSTPSSPANSNNTFFNCYLIGGRNSMLFDGTNAIATMTGLTVGSCLIEDFGLVGVNVGANVGSITVDSNSIYHTTAFSAVNSPTAIQFNVSTNGVAGNVTKNRISGIKTTLANTSVTGISFTVSTFTGNVFNVVNNSLILLAANNTVNATAAGGLTGIRFQGNGSAECNVYYNTVRIGGTAVGGTVSAFGIRSVCLGKYNAGTANIFRSKNNLFINTRTGGASTQNGHIGAWINTNTAGTHDIDFNTYQGSPFFAGWAGTIYGDEAGYKAVVTPNDQSAAFGTVTFLNATGPDLAAGNGVRVALANPILGITTDINGTVRSANDPFRGAMESATPFDTNDISVIIVYTYGKIPVGTTDTARAVIRNNGTRALSSAYVKLTGSLSAFADSVQIFNLSKLKDTIVQLAPYTPSLIGFDTLKVSVAGDQNNTNNLATWVRENTLNSLTYTNVTLPRTGAVGNTGQGEIVAKFYTPVPNSVNQVNVNFNTSGLPFQVVIYEDSGATFGPKRVPFWISANQSTVVGTFNLSIPSVPVSGNFYIGVRQTSANNVGFGFQNENPIRNKTFYFRQDDALAAGTYLGLPWNDFAIVSTNQFRFMIEPRLKINDDLGVIDIAAPGTGCINLGVQPLKVRVQNLGLLSQNFAVDSLKIFGTLTKPSGSIFNFGPINITSGFVATDDVIDVDLTTSFNFDSVGTYTVKAWSVFGVDNNRVNDTLLAAQRTFLAVNASPFIQNFNAALTTPLGWTPARFAVTGAIGVNNTNAMRVNLLNVSTFAANATLQTPRVSGLTAGSLLRFDYRITNFANGAATTLLNTDSIKVLVSTDCGNTFTMVNLINGTNHIPSANYITYAVPLGSFVGNDVVIKFVCDWFGTTNDANVDLDNIRVVDGVNDVGALKVIAPCRSVIAGSASLAPEITVNNYGSAAQSNIAVNVSITGAATYTGTFTIPNLAAGASTSVNMSTLFNPATAGAYTLKAWSSLVGDGDPSNDTVTTTFNVTNLNLGDSSVRALTFATTGSVVRTANSAVLNPTSGITIEGWINRAASVGRRTIVAKDSAIGFIQYSLVLNDTNCLEFTLNTVAGFVQVVAPGAVPAAYTHVAATFDGTVVKIYVNGTVTFSANVTTSTIVTNNYDVFVGNHNLGTTTFGGSIDELRIWDVARTDDQLRMNMHHRLANQPNVNLVAYYRFDEGTGTFATDASGNCNTGVFGTAAPTWAAATYPLGTPAVATQTVFFDGQQTFTGTGVIISYNSFVGSDTVYVHKFTGTQQGTSPVVSPGGVTTAYPAYWLLYKYGNGTFSTLNSSIQFSLGTGLSSGVVVNDLKLFNRANTSTTGWTLTNSAASAVSFANKTVDYSLSAPLFNSQLMVGANNNPLAVTMLSFAGSASRADAVLRWATSSENNNRGFAVERSFDGKRFAEIGFVRGAVNSSRVNSYSYADKNIFASQRMAYYRLKQVDLNGDYTYSSVVLINVDQTGKAEVAVYPNPMQKELNIELESANASAAQITITDITGKVVKEISMGLTEGFNKLTFSELSGIQTGVYIINITSEGVVLYNNKLVKTE